MKKSPFVKAIVLTCFVALLTGFVAYKAGAFDTNSKSSPLVKNSLPKNGNTAIDSPGTKKNEPMIMPSSKSMMIVDRSQNDKQADSKKQVKKKRKQKATPVQNNNTNVNNNNANKPSPIMPSSKSGRIM